MRLANKFQQANIEPTLSTLEYQIEEALREAVPQHLILGSSSDGTNSTKQIKATVDHTSLYRSVEKELNLPDKFLSHGKWKVKRKDIVNDEVVSTTISLSFTPSILSSQPFYCQCSHLHLLSYLY